MNRQPTPSPRHATGPRGRSLLGTIAAVVAGLASVVAGTHETASAGTQECVAVFDPAFVDWLHRTYPSQRFSAFVDDRRTGCTHELDADRPMTSASVIKLSFASGLLLRAQDEGRDLTAAERDLVVPMMTRSADDPASRIWERLGGTSGLRTVYERLGLTATEASPPKWGHTTTTARDQAELVGRVEASDPGALGIEARQTILWLMRNVVESQRWGIGAGLRDRSHVSLKNGFAPSHCCGWRLNSVGHVRHPHNADDRLVAILTDGWRSEAQGIRGVEDVARHINERLSLEPTTAAVGQRGRSSISADTPVPMHAWISEGRHRPGICPFW